MPKTTKNTLFYQKDSETVRQAPQNYLIAHRRNGSWRSEPDLASDLKLATAVFKAIHNYNTKYGSGVNVIEKANKSLTNHKFFDILRLTVKRG